MPKHSDRVLMLVVLLLGVCAVLFLEMMMIYPKHLPSTNFMEPRKLTAMDSVKINSLSTVPKNTTKDWRDWTPNFSGTVAADIHGYGSRIWQSLQLVEGATAADAANKLLAIAGADLTLIQVGGCDGAWEMTNDPVQALLQNPRVHAIVFEPVPPLFAELDKRLMTLPEAQQRLLAVNAAVCLHEEASVPFFVVSPRFAIEHPTSEHWAQKELGSFDRQHLRKHKIPTEYIEIINVKCVTPAGSLEQPKSPIGKQASTVDAIIVDAEGLDGDLTMAFLDIPEFRPPLIIFEQKHLKRPKLEAVLRRLRDERYVHWRDKDQIVAVLAAPPSSTAADAAE